MKKSSAFRGGNIPLDIYAEFAACLSTESMEWLMEYRTRQSAAIHIQHHVRKWQARIEERRSTLVACSRALHVWRTFTREERKKAEAMSVVRKIAKTYIAKSLVGWMKKDRAARTIQIFYRKRQSQKSHALKVILACILRRDIGRYLEELREARTERMVISPEPSPASPEIAVAVTRKERAKKIVDVLDTDDSGSDRSPTIHGGLGRLPVRVFPGEEEDVEGVLSWDERRAGRVILRGIRRFIHEKKLRRMKVKILVHLVTRLQAIVRGRNVRRQLKTEREIADLKRRFREKTKQEVVVIGHVMPAVPPPPRDAMPQRVGLVQETASPTPVDVKVTVIDQVPSISVHVPEPIDLNQMELGPVLDDVVESNDLRTPPVNAPDVVEELKRESPDEEHHMQELDVPAHEEPGMVTPKQADEPEEVDVILPQDVEGVLAAGVVVDVLSPAKGLRLDENAETDWVVREVDEVEVYEMQYETLRLAARKIQRVFRRYLTRRKYLAYINGQDLQQAREAEATLQQLVDDAEALEGDGDVGEGDDGVDAEGEEEVPKEVKPRVLPAAVVNSDAINTEGCVIM